MSEKTSWPAFIVGQLGSVVGVLALLGLLLLSFSWVVWTFKVLQGMINSIPK